MEGIVARNSHVWWQRLLAHRLIVIIEPLALIAA